MLPNTSKKILPTDLESKAGVADAFQKILQPLIPLLSEHPGHLKLGTSGSVYTEDRRQAEAFLRPLWGFGPYLVEADDEHWSLFLKGIIAGTDPDSPEYWGAVTDYDQLIVEMAALSTTLMLVPEKSWQQLTKQQQENLHAWLIQVNQHDIPRNNWYFFRILVNTAMKKFQMPYSQAQIDDDFAVVETFYQGEGWYCDGVPTQMDYYISFAIHYYSLIYLKLSGDPDQERLKKIRERATAFAQTFKYWFDATGESLPFGRSLTYRFAQVSFFSALVFAEVEALPWGEIKGIISRHLANWFNADIFTNDGLLSVGYHYQNLVFAEGYNAPGSPYWSMKAFLLLAAPQDHPYWQAAAQPLQITEKVLSHPVSKNFYQYNEDLSHLQAFPAGQFIYYQSHANAKYSKFVYSSHFGFSTPKSDYWYYEGAYDNCLALAEDDHYFRTKGPTEKAIIENDRIIHEWQPWSDVNVRSTIVPLNGCHLRIQQIDSKRPLVAYEGAFTVPFEGIVPQAGETQAKADSQIGSSMIQNISGFQTAGIVKVEPNTNLLYPATVLPHLRTELAPGSHTLVSLVSGLLPGEDFVAPDIQLDKGEILIQQKEIQVTVVL